MIKIIPATPQGLFPQRLEDLADKVSHFLTEESSEGRTLEFVRIFLSDAQNQQALLEGSDLFHLLSTHCPAISIIEQQPLDGSKISLLLKTEYKANSTAAPISGTAAPNSPIFHSLRLTDEEAKGRNSYEQTELLFNKYLSLIASLSNNDTKSSNPAESTNLTLGQHCVRTWIYVSDIDNNYAGMVKARNDIFARHGLTADTHYIASTGIEGRTAVRQACVAIDFLTYPSIKESDKKYLKALTHLNPTHEYGVAFERATSVTTAPVPCFRSESERSAAPTQRIFISGTASIDRFGKVIHIGDVTKQTERLLENIDALLRDGGTDISAMQYFIIYLRDPSDYHFVDDYMNQHFPSTPHIIVQGKVCRPEWLVEMEGEAVTPKAP